MGEAAMMNDRMRTAYDTIAAEFAARHGAMVPVLAALAEAFLGHLPPNPTILEAGCGAGRDMAWFEARGAAVTGIDLSPGMLAVARPLVEGSLLEMDLTRIDLPDTSFDGVWCNAALLHIPKADAPTVLAQFRRVLRPGGIAMVSLQGGDGEGWESNVYTGVERFFARYTATEAEALLAENGFDVLSLEEHRSSVTWLHAINRLRT
jgi:SAM-dependent methyltransferase